MQKLHRLFSMGLLLAVSIFSQTLTAQEKLVVPAAFESRFCEACHAVDKKAVGPALKDIAAKYKDKADAVDYLRAKVKNGSQGVWGNIPMPASASATDAEVAELVDWILKLAK
jgi:cytochrome c551/c552